MSSSKGSWVISSGGNMLHFYKLILRICHLQTADQQYQEAFNDELESFKERVRSRAKIRIEKAMREYEEEERQKRLGPGGLDPVDVYESLPAVSTFDVKNPQDSLLIVSCKFKMPHVYVLNCRRCRNALTTRTSRCYKMLLAKWTQR